jgi:hypothetical protein
MKGCCTRCICDGNKVGHPLDPSLELPFHMIQIILLATAFVVGHLAMGISDLPYLVKIPLYDNASLAFLYLVILDIFLSQSYLL